MTTVFQIGDIERIPLGTSYTAIVSHMGRVLAHYAPDTDFAIDFTGVGRPVFDLFRYANIYPTGVLITGGTVETTVGEIVHVPKIVLCSQLQALFDTGRLRIQKDLPEARVLVEELLDFRVQYTAAGNVTFSARQGRNDDLVLAVAIATYRAGGGGTRYKALSDFYAMNSARQRGAPSPARSYLGLDLGQSNDYSAFAVVRAVEL
jgi:hypothetical protein